jgi:2,3-bisphosphoglycerate-dependent phosphoglycerate mutase
MQVLTTAPSLPHRYDVKPPKVSSFSRHYPGNDQRYVENMLDVRLSFKESVIRSLERGSLSLHRKLPHSESLKVTRRPFPSASPSPFPSPSPSPFPPSPLPCQDCMERTIPYFVNNIEKNAIAKGKNVLIASSENAIRGLLMHLLEIPTDRIVDIEIPTGLPLVYDLRHKCLRLLEGDFEDYNFGAAADLLFTECALPDDRYEELTLSPIVEDVAELSNS